MPLGNPFMGFRQPDTMVLTFSLLVGIGWDKRAVIIICYFLARSFKDMGADPSRVDSGRVTQEQFLTNTMISQGRFSWLKPLP